MTAQQNGRDFENKIHKLLTKTNLNVLREIDIKHRFGQNISGIDHLIEFNNCCLCFQDKYQKTPISNSQVGHFITCVNNLSDILMKKCIGIFISNTDFSIISKQQIDLENSKNKNEFMIIFDNNYVELMRKIYFYFHSNGIWFYDGQDSMMIY